MDTYPAFTNFSLLMGDWFLRPGTMSTVHVALRTEWYRFATMDPGVLYPAAPMDTLVNTSFMEMNGETVYAAEGMDLSRTPALSVSLLSCIDCETIVPAV